MFNPLVAAHNIKLYTTGYAYSTKKADLDHCIIILFNTSIN